MTTDTPTINPADQRFITIAIEKVIQLYQAGHTDQAIAQFSDILALYPENDEIKFKLARLYQHAGRSNEALPLLESITGQSPYFHDALFTLGLLLGERRDFVKAADCLSRLLESGDNRVECYNNLAHFLIELKRPIEAQNYLFRSIQVAPDHADTYNYLGNLYLNHWRLSEAGEQYRRVIELRPDFASAYGNLAWVATLEGKVAEAMELYRTALELQPNFRIAIDNYLFALNYTDNCSPEHVRDEHIRLADSTYGSDGVQAPQRRWSGGKIRVGYVSPDFKTHSVGFFFEPVLRNHDSSRFEIFCYDVVAAPDETTDRMKNLGWAWRTVYGLSDGEIAKQIRSDEIDILVDLAGHTKGNRLGVFAKRPAPVQVTWLGYPNTTGLKQIDFRLTDNFADPPGISDRLNAERLVRLPQSFLCYAPPTSVPDVGQLMDGPIIYCSFNNNPKISDTILRLWSRVLHSIPDSRLCLKNGSLTDPGVQNHLIGRFKAYGIDPSRLNLIAFSESREKHLQLYSAGHIALDTFPYHGTTTTCEAILMGVPVVTLSGSTHASRVGVSILNNIGLSELIARDADQYVEIAVGLAKNRDRLQLYRHCLRGQLLSSQMTDATTFTVNLEQAYQRMLIQNIT